MCLHTPHAGQRSPSASSQRGADSGRPWVWGMGPLNRAVRRPGVNKTMRWMPHPPPINKCYDYLSLSFQICYKSLMSSKIISKLSLLKSFNFKRTQYYENYFFLLLYFNFKNKLRELSPQVYWRDNNHPGTDSPCNKISSWCILLMSLSSQPNMSTLSPVIVYTACSYENTIFMGKF